MHFNFNLPPLTTILLASLPFVIAELLTIPIPATPTSITCPMTINTFHPFNFDPVQTVYQDIATHTNTVDCGPCTAVVVRNIGGHGPVRHITATATATGTAIGSINTVEAYVCRNGTNTMSDVPMVTGKSSRFGVGPQV